MKQRNCLRVGERNKEEGAHDKRRGRGLALWTKEACCLFTTNATRGMDDQCSSVPLHAAAPFLS